MRDPQVPAAGILFGAAYYAEYQRGADVAADLDLMRAAGFTVIRVGESVWSTWEPEEGVFDLEWVVPVLDAAAERGIGVILGTPTYAVPPWLQRRHPEIAADCATGTPMQWGARQEMDFTHGAFRYYAERVIRRIVGRFHDHPAVIGYQVDNEPGIRLLYNDSVFQQFVDDLRRRYGTVDKLNEEWGLVYWSHRLTTWADLWRPDGNAQPQYDLAWRTFQARLVTDFIAWQAHIVRDVAGPDAIVTTCISYDQVGVADAELAGELDVASGNAYYEMQDSLTHPSSLPRAVGATAWIVRGPWALAELADTMYSSKQAPFLVTETNAGSIGNAFINQSPYDGQWRQAAWLLVARGARAIEYWHWNTLTFGAETFWGGVLPHDGRPGRTYAELATIGEDFAAVGSLFDNAEPDYDIAVLYDSRSKFALSKQAPFGTATSHVDADAYRRIVASFTRGAFDAKRQARLLRPEHLFGPDGPSPADLATRYPVLVAAAYFSASNEHLDTLREYAEAGGHLVLGPKTGAGDLEGRARSEAKPARLAEAAGATYVEFANPDTALPIVTEMTSTSVAGHGLSYVEGLSVTGADVVAGYEHPHFGRWAAITTRAVGAGRITVVGTVPDQELGRTLTEWLTPAPVSGWQLPDSITAHTSTTPDGVRLHVLHNWSWTPATVTTRELLRDAVTGAQHAVGSELSLDAWGVLILVNDDSGYTRPGNDRRFEPAGLRTQPQTQHPAP